MWWATVSPFNCTLGGVNISPLYFNPGGTCTNNVILTHNNPTQKSRLICCVPQNNLNSPFLRSTAYANEGVYVGCIYLAYSFFLLLIESKRYGIGLVYPNDTITYRYRVSLQSILNILITGYGFTQWVTAVAAIPVLYLAIIQAVAAYRQEAGDGRNLEKPSDKSIIQQIKDKYTSTIKYLKSFFTIEYLDLLLIPDQISKNVIILIFLAANIIFFITILLQWYGIITTVKQQMLDGTLDLTGNTRLAHMMRKAVRYGPPTYAGKISDYMCVKCVCTI